MTLFISLLYYGNCKEKETLNKKFKAITDVESDGENIQCEKNIQNSYFESPLINSVFTIPECIKQDHVVLSELNVQSFTKYLGQTRFIAQ